jgi:hypothetical protein
MTSAVLLGEACFQLFFVGGGDREGGVDLAHAARRGHAGDDDLLDSAATSLEVAVSGAAVVCGRPGRAWPGPVLVQQGQDGQ